MRTNAVLAERLCEAKYSELYPPEGALIKRWASPVCKCALPTSEDLYLDSEKGMMVLSSGRCAPCSLASSIEDSTSRPSELRKRTLVLVLGQVVLTEPLRFRLGHPMDHSNAADSPRRFAPEMRTAHALACPLMGLLGGYCRSHSLSEPCWVGYGYSDTCFTSEAPSRAFSCV